MSNAHSLSWPEITTLVASLGLAVNASIGYYLMKKSNSRRKLKTLRVQATRNPKNPRHYP